MSASVLEALAELDVLRQLINLQTRSIRRQDLYDPTSQILQRLLYAQDRQLPQVSLADDLQLSVSQTQKLSEALQSSGLVDHLLIAPTSSIHRIQECHVTAYHILWDLVHTLLADDRGSATRAGATA